MRSRRRSSRDASACCGCWPSFSVRGDPGFKVLGSGFRIGFRIAKAAGDSMAAPLTKTPGGDASSTADRSRSRGRLAAGMVLIGLATFVVRWLLIGSFSNAHFDHVARANQV